MDKIDHENADIEQYNKGIEQENAESSESYEEWLVKAAKAARNDALICYVVAGLAFSFGGLLVVVAPVFGYGIGEAVLPGVILIAAGIYNVVVAKRASAQAKQFKADAAVKKEEQ